MELSSITIRFDEDFLDSETLTFDLYNTVTTITETFLYTCTDGVRSVDEFIEVETPVSGDTGSATCNSYESAIFEDYGTTKWTITKSSTTSIKLTSVSADTVFQNASSAQDVVFTYETSPPPPPKDSYYFEFTDLVGIEHRVEIENTNSDTVNFVEIKGNYTIENPSDEDVLSPLRPKQVTCNLEASTDLTFEDLYEEEERVYKVTIIRDGNTIFVGWLSSDGLYENYVSDKWIISLSAIDGLGYLEDISYIDELGALYSGKQTDIEKLTNVLYKTELSLGFRTSINIFYEGLSGVDILSNTYFNAERYYTEDNNEPFNCKEILLSILEKYNAVITQQNGLWYIYKPNEIFDSANVTFYNYDSDGVLVVGENTVTEDLTFNLGSQIDGYYPHFVNENQQKSLRRSLGVYKVNLKYGRVFPYFTNVNVNWTDASTLPDWTIVNSNFVEPYNNLQGLKITNAASPIVVLNTSNYTVDESPRIQFQVTYSNLNDINPIVGTGGATFNCKIVYVKGGNTYYLTKQGNWTTSDDLIQHAIGYGEKNFTLKVASNEPVPEPDGDIRIDVWDAGVGTAIYPLAVHSIYLQTYVGQDEPQGQFYTIEKLVKATPNTSDVKKLIHGDVPDNTFYSAIYKNDETTNTEFWYRKDYGESKNLLRIMIEDRLRIAYSPQVIFEGDVYGYIPFLSRLNINNVKDKMMLLEWGYDSFSNTTRIKAIELLNTDFQNINVAYSVTDDYGETVKPTITS